MRKQEIKSNKINDFVKTRFENIPISEIIISQSTMRKFVEDEAFNELVNSIKIVGLINPITVYQEGERKFLIAGLRRLKAFEKLGRREINSTIIEADKREYLKIQYMENVMRENINPIQEGEFLAYCKEKLGVTNEELGRLMGKSESYIAKRVYLSEQDEIIKEAVISGKISINAGCIIAKCKDKNKLAFLIDYLDETKLRDMDLKGFVEQVMNEGLNEYITDEAKNNDGKVYTELYNKPKIQCEVCFLNQPIDEIKIMRVCKECERLIEETRRVE